MTIRRLSGVLVAIVTVIAGAGCGGSEEARPDLAFVSTRDGDYAIFEMNADGGAQHRLTPRRSRRVVSCQALLPDRARLVTRWFQDRFLEPALGDVRPLRHERGRDRDGAVDLGRKERFPPDLVSQRDDHRLRTSRRHLRHERGRLRSAARLRPERGGVGARLVSGRRVDRIRPSDSWHTRAGDMDHASERIRRPRADLGWRDGLTRRPGRPTASASSSAPTRTAESSSSTPLASTVRGCAA